MPNTLQVKRSATPAKIPLTTDLALGELAVNTFDGKLYLKKNNGTESIVEVGVGTLGPPAIPSPKSITILAPVAGDNITCFWVPANVYVSQIEFLLQGSGSTATVSILAGSNRSTSTLTVLAAQALAATNTSGTNVVAPTTADISAGFFVWISITAAAGTPSELHATFVFDVNPNA